VEREVGRKIEKKVDREECGKIGMEGGRE